MEPKFTYQILQLVPTDVFYAFLLSQLDKDKLPPRDALQIDTTLFRIPYFETLDKTLDFIETHVKAFFSYEIKRWLGKHATHNIEESFSDFITCFELKLHSYLYSTLPIQQVETALGIKAKPSLLSALIAQDGIKADRLTLESLQENHTIVLINRLKSDDLSKFVEENADMLLELEKTRLALFNFKGNDALIANRHFQITLHQHIVDIEGMDKYLTASHHRHRLFDI